VASDFGAAETVALRNSQRPAKVSPPVAAARRRPYEHDNRVPFVEDKEATYCGIDQKTIRFRYCWFALPGRATESGAEFKLRRRSTFTPEPKRSEAAQ